MGRAQKGGKSKHEYRNSKQNGVSRKIVSDFGVQNSDFLFELPLKKEGVAVKWVNRLFTKNTALCQVVKTTYRV